MLRIVFVKLLQHSEVFCSLLVLLWYLLKCGSSVTLQFLDLQVR